MVTSPGTDLDRWQHFCEVVTRISHRRASMFYAIWNFQPRQWHLRSWNIDEYQGFMNSKSAHHYSAGTLLCDLSSRRDYRQTFSAQTRIDVSKYACRYDWHEQWLESAVDCFFSSWWYLPALNSRKAQNIPAHRTFVDRPNSRLGGAGTQKWTAWDAYVTIFSCTQPRQPFLVRRPGLVTQEISRHVRWR